MPPSFRSISDNAPSSRKPVFPRLVRALLARPVTHIGAGLGILLLDYWTGPFLMFPILFVIPVILSAWWCSARLGYALAVLLPVGRCLIAIFVDLREIILVNAINAVIRIVVLGFMVFLVARTARQAREMKTLEGLLRICMFCKRIRDQRDGWQQLETYIARHSEADFSHGLCPECAQKHYGDLLGAKSNV